MKKLILFLSIAFATPTLAQEEAAVKATIDRLFEGMKNHDTTVVRSVFHETARLLSISKNAKGITKIDNQTIAMFIKGIAGIPATVQIEERLLSYEIRIDDALATAWTPYEFYVNGKFSHGGIDAFQLCKTADGWRIIQIADTRRK